MEETSIERLSVRSSRNRLSILQMLKRDVQSSEQMEHLFFETFPDPNDSEVTRFANSLLILNGNRPIETRKQILNHFCETNGIIHWESFDPTAKIHFFKLKTR